MHKFITRDFPNAEKNAVSSLQGKQYFKSAQLFGSDRLAASIENLRRYLVSKGFGAAAQACPGLLGETRLAKGVELPGRLGLFAKSSGEDIVLFARYESIGPGGSAKENAVCVASYFSSINSPLVMESLEMLEHAGSADFRQGIELVSQDLLVLVRQEGSALSVYLARARITPRAEMP
ncbi:MAG: hypothetical protein WC506_06950 [Candidatus Micrarchaeia archaeon]